MLFNEVYLMQFFLSNNYNAIKLVKSLLIA